MSGFVKPSETFLKERLVSFKEDIRALSDNHAVQKHLTQGACCLFSEDLYFDLKKQISQQFEIHPNEVLVVGSAKLGFSIAPGKRFRLFNDESDIDVALVAPKLFEQVWLEVHEYREGGAYWEQFGAFRKYLFNGWIRPDKLPPSSQFTWGAAWWEYFRSLSNSGRFGPYIVHAGLYKSWHFLESYQRRCIRNCKNIEI